MHCMIQILTQYVSLCSDGETVAQLNSLLENSELLNELLQFFFLLWPLY